MTEVVLSLEQELCEQSELTGNKAAALARLARRGYPVLPGVCVTAAAFDSRSSRWESSLKASLASIAPPWIVRSSSTAEDAASHAFAGTFASIAGVSGAAALIEAVREVRASLDSETARRQAEYLHVDLAGVRMAVLVQPIARADAGGVAFGCDPVSGAPVVLIEANYGLPQTVVGGEVSPDGFEVDGDEAIVRTPGTKRRKAVLKSGEVVCVPTTEAERTEAAISDPTVIDLARLVRRLGDLFASPQDVEWALADGRLLILQARPITTVRASKGRR